MDQNSMGARILIGIKLLHTFVWLLVVACIASIPMEGIAGHYCAAAILTAIVLLECSVLALNRGRCPLTNLAQRFTEERRANFDIYLPEWLARHNKAIFGSLFVAGIVVAAISWELARR